MAIPFEQIRAKLTPDQRAKADALAARLIAREHLRRETRESLRMSQASLASTLGVEQSAVSELERGADLYVSKLRKHLKAMGADLEIIVRFPDKPPVRIVQFEGPEVRLGKRRRKPKSEAVSREKSPG